MCRSASVFGGASVTLFLSLLLCAAFASVAGQEVTPGVSDPELPCDPPCVNGVCTAYQGNLSCKCFGNWSGDDCSVSACDEGEKCLNGGTCVPNPNNISQYLCACPLFYFGDICQYTTNETHGPNSCEVVQNRCNGSTCHNLEGDGHQCFCNPGTWGVGCNYTYDNTEGRDDRCRSESCNNGVCIWDESFGFHASGCQCEPGWKRLFNCQKVNGPRQYCEDNPCGEYGECSYVFPEYDPSIDPADFAPFGYFCECDGHHSGQNCSEPFNICERNPCVVGSCNATHDGHYFHCTCPPGRRGPRCEFFDNPCDTFDCENEGKCVPGAFPNADGSYNSSDAICVCCNGFSGNHCEIASENHTFCQPNPCQNGAGCHLLSETEYKCDCHDGFTGVNCELSDLCLPEHSSCDTQHIDSCFVVPDGDGNEPREVCVCKEGWGGERCSDDIDECLDSSTTLCLNGGTCVNRAGSFECSCTVNYTGKNCDTYVPKPVNCTSSQMCLNGGTCVDKEPGEMICMCPDGFTGDLCDRRACQYDDCVDLGRNARCDMKCFTEECGFDGGERYCLPNSTTGDPWDSCPIAHICRQRLENGACDPECNTRDCLFDSYECVPHPDCPSNLLAVCQNEMEDGVCLEECNTAQCPFDSEDCDSREYLNDILVVYILGKAGQSFSENTEAQQLFKEAVGLITNTNPVIESFILLSAEEGLKEGIVVPEGQNLYRVTLKLDTEYCSDQCIKSVEEAVKFLDAYYASGQDIAGFSYVKSEAEEDPTEPPGTSTPNTLLAICVTFTVVVCLGVFVVAGVLVRKRKVIRAKIFYPGQSQVNDSAQDQAPPNKKRKTAQSDVSSGNLVNSTEESSMTASCTSGEYIREGSRAAKMEGSGKITWVDYKVPVGDSPGHDPSDVAVVSQVGSDPRKWNLLHYKAVQNPEVMRNLLEKCRGDDSKKWDVNTAGPGGYTPLMLAVTQKTGERFGFPSRSSSSSDSSGDHTEHNGLLPHMVKTHHQLVPHSDTSSPSGSLPSSPLNSTVDALLTARVKLDATNDYGRTALHLAAVCARGDYVKKLLSAGANPNVQDNWGQSPLHAAIGAAAEGAFQMLLDFPKTDINLKSDGGISPLMDAVKSTNMYMVKQLVKKSADISLTDYEGRTAVHWAAMTEHVEALKLLIRQGPDTIKDAQDNKGQTPLFLACREGAAECARHLLDVFANATLLDNLDRSPMTIAFERQHLFIIEMLKSHGPYHYQLPAGTNGRHTHSVPHHIQLAQQQQQHELAMRQQMASQSAYAYAHQPPTSHHDMMVEMQPMGHPPPPPALEHYSGPEMQLPPRGQTFGDIGYPVSSAMDLGLPGNPSYSKQMSTPHFFSNTLAHATENGGVHTPTGAAPPQSFYPPSTSSQLPSTSAESNFSPPTRSYHHQHSASPPTQLQPTSTPDLPSISTSYATQPHPRTASVSSGVPQPDSAPYSAYPTSAGHFVVTSTASDSEQRMVSELITSISDSSPPQQQQLYSPPQQPHSASSVHSNRSPSALYPSPPNSETIQHSSENPHQNGMPTVLYPHASPPSLTPSPEGRDETAPHNITTIEGLVQQHDYPVLYGGADSYNYGAGIRFAQDYSTETTV